MSEQKVPITLYAEMTPNPATMKFVANKMLLLEDDAVTFDSMQEAKGYSPLAEALFEFPFVESVFITGNFITVTKTDNVDWDFIVMELREFIRNWLVDGKELLIRMPMPKESGAENSGLNKKFAPSEYDQQIVALLD